MTDEQAINILSQIASKFIGTRAEHELVEQALKTISAAIEQKEANAKTSHAS